MYIIGLLIQPQQQLPILIIILALVLSTKQIIFPHNILDIIAMSDKGFHNLKRNNNHSNNLNKHSK